MDGAFAVPFFPQQKRTWHVAMKCNYKVQLKGRLGKILMEEFCEV